MHNGKINIDPKLRRLLYVTSLELNQRNELGIIHKVPIPFKEENSFIKKILIALRAKTIIT